MVSWRDERGFGLAELLVPSAALSSASRTISTDAGALTSAAATSLTLLDQDKGTAVIYALTGDVLNATLTRTASGVADVVIGGVQALTFTYRDVNNNVHGVPVGAPSRCSGSTSRSGRRARTRSWPKRLRCPTNDFDRL